MARLDTAAWCNLSFSGETLAFDSAYMCLYTAVIINIIIRSDPAEAQEQLHDGLRGAVRDLSS